MKITQSRLLTAVSSEGVLRFDSVTGQCDSSDFDADSPGGTPVRIDITELIFTYGELDDSYDILDLGYWTEDGRYEPPVQDWRELKLAYALSSLQEEL
jgi:hypothetical protein